MPPCGGLSCSFLGINLGPGTCCNYKTDVTWIDKLLLFVLAIRESAASSFLLPFDLVNQLRIVTQPQFATHHGETAGRPRSDLDRSFFLPQTRTPRGSPRTIAHPSRSQSLFYRQIPSSPSRSYPRVHRLEKPARSQEMATCRCKVA
jgi:hypothetical protein